MYLERSDSPLRLVSSKLTTEARANIGYVGGRWSLLAMSLPQLAKFGADLYLHGPVLDRTGLDGLFDYNQSIADVEPDYGDRGASFRRFLSQAGLKVTRTKGAVDAFVIEFASRPSAN